MASPSVSAGEEVYRVTTLELFFDLVFVFAVTQLSHVLVKELNVLGLAQVVLMFGVLWWMYGGYAWLTNTLTPTTAGRRLLLLVGMGGFFMVALATPTAFKGGGVLWGLGYLVLVLAHVTLYAQGNPNILRVLPANLLAAVLIIGAGLLDHGPAVYVLWTLALVVPIVQPYIVPAGGLFTIQPAHIVERHGLLVMITIGESVIAVGAGAEHAHLDAGLVVAVLLGLALAAAVWWSYFARDDERAVESLTAAGDVTRTQMTMFGYFYAHIPLVIGIIVAAAGMGTAVGHAWDGLHTGPALALAGGVALYLAGDAAFRRAVRIGPSRIRLGAAAAALAATPLGLWLAAAEIAALVLVVAAALVLEHAAPRPDAAVPGLGQSSGD
ncbi:low temperature requirement protein LtrA [Actinomadura coerulea]|uniref:Low temperature requirement protein LtrA n=1 Tax=Actinomadura coerulea TaxID=46159 RepID=A0A7X0G409_9ACTN|nr:low temperature requirement protein A [Actinomadura coerulea]MBB6398961.1 low temperature requirement protein LtrA [Actinomadura coerulea]GGP97998.1 low temperature requirement protein A [Actinomadura coerulea]